MLAKGDAVNESFLARLRASHVIVWLPGYLAAAWVTVEVVALLGDVFDWSAIVPRAAVLVAAWGIPIVIILTWFHGPRGSQRASPVELLLLLMCVAGAAVSVLMQWRAMPAGGLDADDFIERAAKDVADRSVAVLSLVGLDARPEQKRFAEGLANQIVGVMSVNDLQAIPNASSEDFRGSGMREAASRIGAAFVLDGTVQLDGSELRVRVHITDARTGVSLWSNDYRRANAETSEMQEQVATHVADVLRCALVSRRPAAGAIDSQTLAIFLRACDKVQRFEQGPEEMYEAARQVTDRAPNFSRGWSMLAMASALAGRNVQSEREDQLREQSGAAAEMARTLDPANAESDLAQSLLLPFTDWRGREKLLERALELDPNSAEANLFRGYLLAEVGRMSDSVTFMRRAVALDPLSPAQRTAMAPILDATGNHAESRSLRERNFRVWPNSPSTWSNRFNAEMFVGQPAFALGMLDAMDTSPVSIEQPAIIALRNFIVARRDGNAAALQAAVKELAALAREGRFDAPRAITAANVAGDLDTGFSLADAFFSMPQNDPARRQPVMTAHRYFLFTLPGAPMRQDPRFIALARRIGLLEYWTETGKWPDFCGDPNLPYDCRAEAVRIG